MCYTAGMQMKLNHERLLGFGGNVGVVFIAVGLVDGLLVRTLTGLNPTQGLWLAAVGVLLIVIASVEEGK